MQERCLLEKNILSAGLQREKSDKLGDTEPSVKTKENSENWNL